MWNSLVVAAATLTPGLANHFAAIAGIGSQMSDQPIAPGRRANLRSPVDDASDHGAHGIFDERAGGMLDPTFLSNLGTTASQLVRSFEALVREKVGTVRSMAVQRSHHWQPDLRPSTNGGQVRRASHRLTSAP